MDLKKYLEVTGIEQKKFAVLIGVTPVSVCNYLHRRRMPSSKVVANIETVTNNKVTLHDLKEYWEMRKTPNDKN